MIERSNSIFKCDLCGLYKTRKLVVPGAGSTKPKFVFLGEAPGKKEDEFGEPFQGRSGRFLKKAIAETGIDLEDVFFTNTIFCRPPDKNNFSKDRKPTVEEQTQCFRNVHNVLSSVFSHKNRFLEIVAVGETSFLWFFEFFNRYVADGQEHIYSNKKSFGETVTRISESGISSFEIFASKTHINVDCLDYNFYPLLARVRPIWHPSYVLHGGGGKVSYGKYAEVLRKILVS